MAGTRTQTILCLYVAVADTAVEYMVVVVVVVVAYDTDECTAVDLINLPVAGTRRQTGYVSMLLTLILLLNTCC